ncbi:DUF305 domain-containing protein [Actinoplanes subtropicus]|uniref:DUF305 domain-containing protein n=1 Tax=Actinoplanes subtropicus TaxID=543632 RepID=UPI0004C4123F|nr:DUF305 domain-containing protein [Actinoplanes subtropicus]
MKSIRPGCRVLIAAAAALTTLTLAACGTDTTGGQNTPAANTGNMAGMSSAAPTGRGFNAADVAFAQMMIPDHRMVADMAKLAETKASSKDLKTLAAQMAKDNTAAVGTMRGWLRKWGEPASGDMAGMTMPGAMTSKDMDMLKSMSGMQFDMMFAQMMVKHHQGSAQMARDEASKGASSDAKAMATDLVTSLAAQAKQLQALTKM